MQIKRYRELPIPSLDGARTKTYNSFMLYLLLAALSSAALTLVLKWFRDPKGSRYGILLGNYLTCMLIAFIQMPDKGRFYAASPSTFLLGGIGGFLFVAGLVTMQSSVRQNGATLTSAFSKLGMLIPLLVSFLFFGDVPTWLQAAGLLFAVGAIIVLNLPRKAEHASDATKSRDLASAQSKYDFAKREMELDSRFSGSQQMMNRWMGIQQLTMSLSQMANASGNMVGEMVRASATMEGVEQTRHNEQLDQIKDLFSQAETMVQAVVQLMQAVLSAENESLMEAIRA